MTRKHTSLLRGQVVFYCNFRYKKAFTNCAFIERDLLLKKHLQLSYLHVTQTKIIKSCIENAKYKYPWVRKCKIGFLLQNIMKCLGWQFQD